MPGEGAAEGLGVIIPHPGCHVAHRPQGPEHSGRVVHPDTRDVLLWSQAGSLPEEPSEVARVEAGNLGELAIGQAFEIVRMNVRRNP